MNLVIIVIEANAMPISVQESTQVLGAYKLYYKGLGLCTILELQLKVHPKPLGSITLLFWEG